MGWIGSVVLFLILPIWYVFQKESAAITKGEKNP